MWLQTKYTFDENSILKWQWPLQQDNAHSITAKMDQEWFEEHNRYEVLTWTPYSPDINPIKHKGGPTSQRTGFQGFATNFLVPKTTAHRQRSCGVHAECLLNSFI